MMFRKSLRAAITALALGSMTLAGAAVTPASAGHRHHKPKVHAKIWHGPVKHYPWKFHPKIYVHDYEDYCWDYKWVWVKKFHKKVLKPIYVC